MRTATPIFAAFAAFGALIICIVGFALVAGIAVSSAPALLLLGAGLLGSPAILGRGRAYRRLHPRPTPTAAVSRQRALSGSADVGWAYAGTDGLPPRVIELRRAFAEGSLSISDFILAMADDDNTLGIWPKPPTPEELRRAFAEGSLSISDFILAMADDDNTLGIWPKPPTPEEEAAAKRRQSNPFSRDYIIGPPPSARALEGLAMMPLERQARGIASPESKAAVALYREQARAARRRARIQALGQASHAERRARMDAIVDAVSRSLITPAQARTWLDSLHDDQ